MAKSGRRTEGECGVAECRVQSSSFAKATEDRAEVL
jgi:hypothetical protein